MFNSSHFSLVKTDFKKYVIFRNNKIICEELKKFRLGHLTSFIFIVRENYEERITRPVGGKGKFKGGINW